MSDAVATFMSLANCDASTARHYIEAAGGDSINRALELYFSQQGYTLRSGGSVGHGEGVPSPSPQHHDRLLRGPTPKTPCSMTSYSFRQSICCSGAFPWIQFFDPTFVPQCRIPTVWTFEIRRPTLGPIPEVCVQVPEGSDENLRIVQVPFSDFSRRLIAFGTNNAPHAVPIYDVTSQTLVCQFRGHESKVFGITGILPTDSDSSPRVVSVGDDDKEGFVWDSLSGEQLGLLPETPVHTSRILHVHEWNDRHVFLGGASGRIDRYDLVAQKKIGSFWKEGRGRNGHVSGLSANVAANLIFSASHSKNQAANRVVRIFSASDHQCQHSLEVRLNASSTCSMDEKNLLLVGLWDGYVAMVDIRRPRKILNTSRLLESGGSVIDIAQLDEDRFVAASVGGVIGIWDLDGSLVGETNIGGRLSGICVFRDMMDFEDRDDECDEERAEDPGHGSPDEFPTNFDPSPSPPHLSEGRDPDLSRGFVRSLLDRCNFLGEKNSELRSQLEYKEHELSSLLSQFEESEKLAEKLQTQLAAAPKQPEDRRSRAVAFLDGMDDDGRAAVRSSESFRRSGVLGCRDHMIPFVGARFVDTRRMQGTDRHVSVVVDPASDEELRTFAQGILEKGDATLDPEFVFAEECDRWRDAFRCDVDTVGRTATMKTAMTSMIEVAEGLSQAVVGFFGGRANRVLQESCLSVLRCVTNKSILLGELKEHGVLCHRALFLKYLCDCVEIPCRLNHVAHTLGVDAGTNEPPNRVHVALRLANSFFVPNLVHDGSLELFDPSLHEWGSVGDDESLLICALELDDKYERLPKVLLGTGAFAQVFGVCVDLVGRETPVRLAVKEVNVSNLETKHPGCDVRVLMREAYLLRSLSHRNVVKLLSAFRIHRHQSLHDFRVVASQRSRDEVFCMVMKNYNMDGASFAANIEKLLPSSLLLRVQELLVLLMSVANGLRYLHSHDIWHLDLKPANILVQWDVDQKIISEVRLCDFGGARDQTTVMMLATPGYTAPEVCKPSSSSHHRYDHRADIFSFGAVMQHYRKFIAAYPLLVDLCRRCLLPDPLSRPGLLEILYLLRQSMLFVDEDLRQQDSFDSESE